MTTPMSSTVAAAVSRVRPTRAWRENWRGDRQRYALRIGLVREQQHRSPHGWNSDTMLSAVGRRDATDRQRLALESVFSFGHRNVVRLHDLMFFRRTPEQRTCDRAGVSPQPPVANSRVGIAD